ncbi:hypothetical protein ACSNOK_32410 [Streptomyces sp. URMC 126]|uniref:hypothetical protein n=1 Tax=Streptomyces sp. URMC 126 TaxID=3423401 RepID=UPI003F1AE64F
MAFPRLRRPTRTGAKCGTSQAGGGTHDGRGRALSGTGGDDHAGVGGEEHTDGREAEREWAGECGEEVAGERGEAPDDAVKSGRDEGACGRTRTEEGMADTA